MTIAAAAEEVAVVASQIQADTGDQDAGLNLAITPLQQRMTEAIRPALLMLWAAVGLVLVIAAANIANLLLMQGASRSRELSIRAALGAPRIRLLRQFATEALLLGLTGGAIGTVLGVWSIPALRNVLPATLPRTSEISVTPSVILFGLALSLVTALVFGAAPALRASIRAPVDDLRDRHGETRGQSRLRAAFVTAQVGVTVILLTLAVLLGRSFLSVTRVQLGFDPSGVVAFDLTLPSARYRGAAAQGEFLGRVAEAMRSIPGVRDAAATGALPMTGTARTTMVPEASSAQSRSMRTSSPHRQGSFQPCGSRSNAAALFTDADSRTGAPVVILSETAVKRFWPDGTDPLGLSVTMREWGDPYAARVIGIVGDVRQSGPETDPAPAAYYPVAQFPETLLRHSIVIRTDGDPLSVVPAARDLVGRLDREQPVASIRTLDQLLATAVRATPIQSDAPRGILHNRSRPRRARALWHRGVRRRATEPGDWLACCAGCAACRCGPACSHPWRRADRLRSRSRERGCVSGLTRDRGTVLRRERRGYDDGGVRAGCRDGYRGACVRRSRAARAED